jgi:gliding motility-associated-like protein
LRSPIDTFFDNCPGLNGLYARISPKIFSRCIDIKGVRAGTDTACYVICNKARTICDTTIFVVTVLDTAFINLHAFDDFDTTRLNRIKEVDVYANDSLGGKIPTSLTIITPPTKGTATVISITKGFINYETSSSPQSCGIDNFRYRVCNGTTCSEATVTIYVQCADSLFVYNAISPNGDGINDNFVIDGLQNYTDNTLLIFNRWGNQIFKTVNYQNDWQGQWNGSELPDGTYFFFLYDNTKNILLKNGYIQINR